MPEKQIRISDESVLKATGKTWAQWRKLLDAKGASKLTHQEIAEVLRKQFHISNGWWEQMITNTYEKLVGRRVLGSSTGAGFMMGAQATFPFDSKAAWKFVTSPSALKIWLGASAKVEKGKTYRSKDGATGEFRVVTPGVNLRLSWKPKGWAKPATLQVRTDPKRKKSAISFHLENLPDIKARLRMKKHWRKILDALQKRAL